LRYYWKSEFLPGLSSELFAKVVESAERIVSPHSGIILFPIGGALKQLPEDHSAVGNRDAVVVLNIAASWDKPEEDDTNIEWARASWRELRRFSTGGTYVNFLTEEEGAERIRAAYRMNYKRLVEIKKKWDPGNLFRMNKNIPPRMEGDAPS
jgi:FAD/FMN-containing dehydrogenase